MSGLVPLPDGRSGLRWGIYSRISGKQGVSTGDDDDDTVSLDTQEQRNRAMVAALDPTGTVVESLVVRDVWTGVELHTRPGLMRTLIPALRRGELDAIACFHPWRWTREPNHAGYLYSELDYYGARIRFAEDDPGDDEKGRLLGYVQHWSGRQDHRTRTEQTHRARTRLVELGNAWVGCKAPYGYRWRYDTIEHPGGRVEHKKIGWRVEPAEARVVIRLFDEIVAGRSLRAIATGLMDDGIPAPKGGADWSIATIRKLVRSSVYVGKAFGLRTEIDKSDHYVGTRGRSVGRRIARQKERDPSEWVALPDGYAPEVVGPERFEAAVRALDGRQRGGRAPADPTVSLLGRGRVRCGYCSRVMAKNGQRRRELRCAGRNAFDRCSSCPSIQIDELDRAALALAAAIIERPEILAERAEAHRASDPTTHDLAMVERTLAKIDRDEKGIALVARGVTSAAAAAPLVAELERLAEQKVAAERDRAELLARREGWARTQRFFDGFAASASKVRARARGFTRADWRETIDALGMTALVYKAGDPSRPERYELQTKLDDLPGGACLMSTTASSCAHQTHQADRDRPLVLSWPASLVRSFPSPRAAA